MPNDWGKAASQLELNMVTRFTTVIHLANAIPKVTLGSGVTNERRIVEGGMGIVEMLFCTSLVALVGAGEQSAYSPRRLQITNTKRQSTICELTFPTTILAVKLNRRRLVVLLEEQIYVYDISNMRLVHTIDTSPNPNAVCALSPSSENCYLLYPSPSPSAASPFSNGPNSGASGGGGGMGLSAGGTGDVLVFDCLSLQVVNIVQAHKTPVTFVTTNSDGTLMATASEKVSLHPSLHPSIHPSLHPY